MNIIDHGAWVLHQPGQSLIDRLMAPANALFCKRTSDDLDWYDFIYQLVDDKMVASGVFAAGSVKMMVLNGRIAAATHDETLLFPQGMSVLEITDYAGSDPQADFGGKYYVAASNSIVDSLPTTSAELLAYVSNKQQEIAQGGFTVNANRSGDALNVSVSTTPDFANYLSSAVQLAQMMVAGSVAAANFDWVETSGTVSLTPQQVINVGVAVAALVQQSFTVMGQLIAAINAATVTTTAQIDAPPSPIPAWPVNS